MLEIPGIQIKTWTLGYIDCSVLFHVYKMGYIGGADQAEL